MRLEPLFCTICLLLLAKARALRNCYSNNIELSPNGRITINSRDYPRGFPTGSGCQFTIVAPYSHQISVQCYYYIGISSNPCDPNDSLWYQPNGTPNLNNARALCGSNQYLQDQSPYNSVTIGYTATYYSGFYQCNFTAVPVNCDCGQRTTTKIVGGERPAANTYPYMAVLLDAGTESSVRGGATLISTTAALSAAHVFIKNGQWLRPIDVGISVGRADLTKGVSGDTPYSFTYEISNYYTHPSYDDTSSANDIAVIITRSYILFNRGVTVICLPRANEPAFTNENQRIIEMGFGTTDYGGAYSRALKSAYAQVMPNSQCRQTYKDLSNFEMCTTTYGHDRNDTCQGDSGGPIILPSYRDFQIGVIKDGIYCGGLYPGKCTRVSPYRSWIVSVSGTRNSFCLYNETNTSN